MTPLAFDSVGRLDDPAVVLVHGWLGDRRDWDAVVAALRAAPGLRLLRLELPGHGASPPAGPDTAHAVTALWATLDAAGVGRATLVGYSMGGRLALSAALSAPRRCAGVVIIAASPGLQDADARAARARLDDARAEELVQLGLARFVEAWYDQPLFRGLAQFPAARAALAERRAEGDAAAMAATLRALSVGRQPWLGSLLGGLPPRSRWLAGELDTAYADLARRAAAVAPDGSATLIPGCSHALLHEAPEAVAAAITGSCAEALDRWPGPARREL